MWKRLSSCVRRHRRKLFIIGGVIGGFALLNSYLKKKLIEWEMKRQQEYFELIKRKSHFEGTLQTCDTALLNFAPKINEIVASTIDVNPVVEALKLKPPNKIELWEELKILVFTQAICEIYAESLLVLLLRVQISILGGYMYSEFYKNRSTCSEIPNLVNSAAENRDNEQKYLSQISAFFDSGIQKLREPIENSVKLALKDISLKDMMTLKDLNEILGMIKRYVSDGSDCALPNVCKYVLLHECVNNDDDDNCSSYLSKVTVETKDILECDDFNKVLGCCVDHGIAVIMDRFSECFTYLGLQESTFLNPNNLSVPLAKIIPLMHTVMSQHKANEQGSLIHILLQQENLKAFGANIYESFSQCTEGT